MEQALARPGSFRDGDVFRVGMPRTDLSVTVKGVPVKAGFALGSYAAFKQMGDHAMVMGDLVLLDQEVPAVMSGLFSGGLEVTAVHNHVNGDLATRDVHALRRTRRRAAARESLAPGALGERDAARRRRPTRRGRRAHHRHEEIERALGRPGRDLGAGVFQVTVPRAEAITENGMPLLPAMGVVTVLNFQALADGKAAITGDFVLLDQEVNPVARMLHGSTAST